MLHFKGTEDNFHRRHNSIVNKGYVAIFLAKCFRNSYFEYSDEFSKTLKSDLRQYFFIAISS